jgi:ABC-type cobalamin/Fe3+-siderophores transport system ATPase subunit
VKQPYHWFCWSKWFWKSTLIKIIFGIETADFKFVRIDGIVKNKTKDLFRELSYLSQENFIPESFTVPSDFTYARQKRKELMHL